MSKFKLFSGGFCAVTAAVAVLFSQGAFKNSDLLFMRAQRPVASFSAPLQYDLKDRVSGVTADFTRASTATYISTQDNLVHSAAINEPRFETDGLLVEPFATTNYIVNSQGENNDGTDWDNWSTVLGTHSLTTASDIFYVTDFPDAKWQRSQYTFTGSEGAGQTIMSQATAVGSFAEGDIVTLSFCIKGVLDFTSTNRLNIMLTARDSGGSYISNPILDTATLTTGTFSGECLSFTTAALPASTSYLVIYLGYRPSSGYPVADDTMDISFTKIQLEKLPVVSSYVPTVSSTATRATEADSVKWALADIPKVNAILSGEGTLAAVFTPGYANTDMTVNSGQISVKNSIYSIMYCLSGGSFKTYDGTSQTIVSSAYSAGIPLVIAAQWGYQNSGEKYRPGYKLLAGSSMSWGSDVAFDGAYDTTGGYLTIGLSSQLPFHIKNLKFYNKKITDAQLKRAFK